MRARVERASRIVRMHELVGKAAESRVAALTQAVARLDAKMSTLAEFIGEQPGEVGAHAQRRIVSLAAERALVSAELAAEHERLVAGRRKTKAAVRLAGTLARTIEERDARTALEDLVLRLAATASRKAPHR